MPKRIDEDQLFETTVAVLAESGYRATTTQEIAARAGGVNEATLFRRYRAKGALINAALTHVLADSPFARVGVSADVTADLAALVRAYVDTADKYGGVVATLLGGEVPRTPELRGAMAALMPNLRNAAEVIAAHQQNGNLSVGDPLQKLIALIGPLLVFGLWARTGGLSRPSPSIDAGSVVADFLDGHRARR